MQVSIDQAKEVVLGLGKALNDETFEVARRYVDDEQQENLRRAKLENGF